MTQRNDGLRGAARQLQRMGRGGDTILAHINPREAALLRAHGGAGTINPRTGLRQFVDVGSGVDVGNGGSDMGHDMSGDVGGDFSPGHEVSSYDNEGSRASAARDITTGATARDPSFGAHAGAPADDGSGIGRGIVETLGGVLGGAAASAATGGLGGGLGMRAGDWLGGKAADAMGLSERSSQAAAADFNADVMGSGGPQGKEVGDFGAGAGNDGSSGRQDWWPALQQSTAPTAQTAAAPQDTFQLPPIGLEQGLRAYSPSDSTSGNDMMRRSGPATPSWSDNASFAKAPDVGSTAPNPGDTLNVPRFTSGQGWDPNYDTSQTMYGQPSDVPPSIANPANPNRAYVPYAGDYLHYGMGPAHSFFYNTDQPLPAAGLSYFRRGGRVPGYADGSMVDDGFTMEERPPYGEPSYAPSINDLTAADRAIPDVGQQPTYRGPDGRYYFATPSPVVQGADPMAERAPLSRPAGIDASQRRSANDFASTYVPMSEDSMTPQAPTARSAQDVGLPQYSGAPQISPYGAAPGYDSDPSLTGRSTRDQSPYGMTPGYDDPALTGRTRYDAPARPYAAGTGSDAVRSPQPDAGYNMNERAPSPQPYYGAPIVAPRSYAAGTGSDAARSAAAPVAYSQMDPVQVTAPRPQPVAYSQMAPTTVQAPRPKPPPPGRRWSGPITPRTLGLQGGLRRRPPPAPTDDPEVAALNRISLERSRLAYNPGLSDRFYRDGGLVRHPTPGRADAVETTVRPGTYIVPADIVSAFGHGNTDAGAKMLEHYDRHAPTANVPHQEPVRVKLSGGEFKIRPEVVAGAGHGDLDAGARLHDDHFLRVRHKAVQTQATLPPMKR